MSDWSSDVCSSDLAERDVARTGLSRRFLCRILRRVEVGSRLPRDRKRALGDAAGKERDRGDEIASQKPDIAVHVGRSEEHTSELQSLMRNSYAVFCLKNKRQQSEQQTAARTDYT